MPMKPLYGVYVFLTPETALILSVSEHGEITGGAFRLQVSCDVKKQEVR